MKSIGAEFYDRIPWRQPHVYVQKSIQHIKYINQAHFKIKYKQIQIFEHYCCDINCIENSDRKYYLLASDPNDTSYTRWSCGSGLANPVQIVSIPPALSNFMLLIKAGDVETNPFTTPSPAQTPTMSDKTFNILQWNANGIGNKQTKLSIFLEAHKVKVAAIQETKLTAKSGSPNIQNYTLVRHDLRQGSGGGLLFIYIHNSASFTRKSLSTTSKNDPHLEELTISIAMDNTELLITNVYIPRPVPVMSVIHHQSITC